MRPRTVAAQALLFEEFLAREAAAGRFTAGCCAPPRKRCACTATATRRRSTRCRQCTTVLRLIPGAEVETIESLCCGMAGSFGYEAEHYDVSMQMAELRCCRRCARRPTR